jgi:uncharacterized membrane protein YiaA
LSEDGVSDVPGNQQIPWVLDEAIMFKFGQKTWQIIIKQQVFGPLLVAFGVVSLSSPMHSDEPIILTSRVSIAALLVVGGLVIMLVQVWPRNLPALDENGSDMSIEGLGRLVRQLTQNYNLLRRQTTQGFMITLTLMALGVVAILIGVFGAVFGVTTDTKVISGIAGTITEMIAGSTLLVYRLNFQRLNEVTDRLEESWRILCANGLAASLPPERQADATLSLIEALVRKPTDNAKLETKR